MTCSELRRHLSLHLDSMLSPETESDLQRHLESCAACADRVRAEERLEQRLGEALRRPEAGDAEAWAAAVGALPRKTRWRGWVAAAAVAIVAVAGWLLLRHRELDLAATLAEHHAHYMAGGSPLGVETADPAAAAKYFDGKLSFACAPSGPVPAGFRLLGARLCYLDGAPTAFYVFHRDRRVIILGVFAGDDLSHFPMARERLAHAAVIHCRVEGMPFVAARGKTRAATAVGDAPPGELAALAESFVDR